MEKKNSGLDEENQNEASVIKEKKNIFTATN
jgi:hypothetical protein